MAPLKAGDPFPSDVSFQYIPWSEDKGEVTACGIPIKYDASKEWADKKVVLFSVPGELGFPLNKGFWSWFMLTCAHRRVHSYLLREPSPRLHQEPSRAEEKGRPDCCGGRVQ